MSASIANDPDDLNQGFKTASYLSVAPISKRDEILERFMAIKNSYEARLFIKEARDAIRLHKREMPERRTWRGKGTEERAGTGTDK